MLDTHTFQYELDGQMVVTSDAILTGRDIRNHAGLHPASDHLLIEIGDATSRSIGLEEEIHLKGGEVTVLRSFRGDRVYSLLINERGFEWGAGEISASDIRRYARVPEDHELILDSDHDQPIEDSGIVCLKPAGVERILSRQPRQLCIIVNAREILVAPGTLSFWEIVRLAFPAAQQGPNICYTVSYRKGHGDHPEGTLIAGESVKLKKRMIFNVSETDKS